MVQPVDGKRDASATWWQYCYSNEAFAEEVAKKVIEEFDRNPDLESIPVTPNDGLERRLVRVFGML